MAKMLRIAFLTGALGLLLTACAAEAPEPPPAPDLPLPPPAPTRAMRAAARAIPPAGPTESNGGPAVAAGHVPAGMTVEEAPAPAAPGWRVARDGTVGCANRATLPVLRDAVDGTPRLLAEARAAGGCRTTFRVNEWALEGSDGDAVQLRLTNGPTLTLWFQRGEVVAP